MDTIETLEEKDRFELYFLWCPRLSPGTDPLFFPVSVG